MSLYVVGDIQGCYRELMQLLDKVGFSFSNDQLWCVGDIVARGPDSLEALRFFADAPTGSVRSVLGNHDLNLKVNSAYLHFDCYLDLKLDLMLDLL